MLRSALEEKVGRVRPDEDPMLAWLPRPAAGPVEQVQERNRR